VRFAPPTASGKAGVREIPGKDGLWQSDHASDPLFGMFDAWTAHVVLDHGGDQAAAVAAMLPAIHAQAAADFDDLGPIPESEKPRRKFELIDADDFSEGPAPEWIVRGVLPRAELAVIYGESGSGKSFFALDLAAAVARGIDWRGCRVRQGQVVYVAAEGSGGFRKRLKAYRKHHGASLRGLLHVLPAAPNLLTDDDKHLAEAISAVGNVALIVVDTLAQITPGANENAGEDMGKVLAHCKRLHAATGALVALVHHAGKDVTKGARGWSGIRAAVDAEIEITNLADTRIARVSKQKDGEDGGMFAFKLLVVPIGMDEDGDVIDSCVVEHQDTVPVRVKAPRGKNQKIALDCGQALIETGNGTFTREELAAAMIPAMEHDASKKDKRRDHALRAISNMIESGFFCMEEERISIPQNPK
jgi:KaiC/GvpD/RAD55 family RecA-like ATPase